MHPPDNDLIMPHHLPILCIYQDIAKTTGRMLSHAKAEQWDQVIALAPEYQSAVSRLYEPDILPDLELTERRHLLSQILDNDAEIRRLALPELERLNQLIYGLQRQRNVLQAYLHQP